MYVYVYICIYLYIVNPMFGHGRTRNWAALTHGLLYQGDKEVHAISDVRTDAKIPSIKKTKFVTTANCNLPYPINSLNLHQKS